MIDWNAPRMTMRRTRSGIGPAIVQDRKPPVLAIRYYMPTPAYQRQDGAPVMARCGWVAFRRYNRLPS